MPKELLKDMKRGNCHDCNAKVGEEHMLGCDTERCPECGTQLIGCDCFTTWDEDSGDALWDEEKLNKTGREKWSGIMFERELKFCENNDLWVKWNNGWSKTDRNDPEATHDINGAVIKIHIDGEEE